ncbi:2-dehydro-3-deoxygalactonokinase [Dyella terrae]|uniref:2-dehydro-3-deoxygalactonokinase n=1 Tax=Dyella terrae TaxID=522259 RepID=UPI001EFEBEC3|nr:2-dehydro-3-deoxygalactonokinase [Dyella terrae]ULU23669.1 2-dehydro-3-deoxygalactonokinase [Dyella terrae]
MMRLIGLDWGTSSLRAFLFDAHGEVSERRHRTWGVRQLPHGGFAGALADVLAGWPTGLPLLSAGMVGSRQGWLEVPYINAPADLGALAAGIRSVDAGDGRSLHIVPGVRDVTGPDVMRGEETQVFGALPSDATGERTLVLPGTHSKWVTTHDGRITHITTLMTGELFALLRHHSILSAVVSDGENSDIDTEAFDAGVRAARDSGEAGALLRLFSARTLVLDGQLSPTSVPSYLSGLMIGEEWRIASTQGWLHADAPPLLVGDTAQRTLYHRAAALFGIHPIDAADDAAARGLWRLAIAARLLEPDTSLAGISH